MKDSRGTDAYRAAGVDLDAAAEVKRRIRDLAGRTLAGGAVGPGLFSGLLPQPDGSLLAATIDGVGTKTRVAAMMKRHRNVGVDIVHHCADDLLVHNARPLLFLDYFGAATLDPDLLLELVEGMSGACLAVGAALIGGETAQMPGTYVEGEYDVVGCMLGRIAPGALVDGRSVETGDAVLGLASSGLHTNGYSLARRALLESGAHSLEERPALLGGTSIGDALLEPHRYYGPAVDIALASNAVTAMAHITGGGMEENLPRVLPKGLGVVVDARAWSVPPLFRLIAEAGGLDAAAMRRTFNMGIGYCVVTRPSVAEGVRDAIARTGLGAFRAGTVVAGEGVRWEG